MRVVLYNSYLLYYSFFRKRSQRTFISRGREMKPTATIAIILLMLSTALSAQERYVVYAEDPVVEKGFAFHTVVVSHDISIDAGDCVIWNSFGNGEAEEFEDGFGKIHLISSNEKTIDWFTLKEMEAYAENVCWPVAYTS